MKQVFQNLKTGAIELADVPTPLCRPGHLLIATRCSLISAGTERMLVEFGRANLLAKAKAQPEKVRQVLDKIKTDGLLPTLEAVFARLDQPLPLGYCNAGVVLEVGAGVKGFSIGDRVVSNGPHAEVVCVPQNLCARIPDNVSDDEAAFTVLAAVGLQGIRLANPTLGENVAVLGLGLVGLLTVQLLVANGCRVLGTDFDAHRLELARQFGAQTVDLSAGQDPVQAALAFSEGRGVDAVIITASTTSSEPVHQAARMCRQRGRIVLVGVTGLELNRADFYEKELTFQVSCSYGPGRYDPNYEEKGHDYPYGFVRWTAQRNFQAVLNLIATGRLNVAPLITHRFPIEEAPKAYDLITGKTGEPFLGVLLTYPDQPNLNRKITLSTFHVLSSNAQCPNVPRVTVGLLGAGNFATTTLLPAMRKVQGIEFVGICAATGLTAHHVGNKFGFRYCTTDENEIFNDPDVNTVVIATRHHLHARQVVATLKAGKNVFCEKPLALNEDELREILQAVTGGTEKEGHRKAEERGTKGSCSPASSHPSTLPQKHFRTSAPLLMVGYNRRFAPMARQLKAFLTDVHEPLVMHYRVNAGYIPPDHWVQDSQQGGGRIIGEVCHFVDFLTFLVGALPVRVYARALPNEGRYRDDNVVITLEFADGSLGTIIYVANGDKSFPKERLEVFGGGAVAVLDDFRHLELVRNRRKKVVRSLLGQDKGHRGEWEAFVAAVQGGGPPPIPIEEIIATTLTTFRVLDSLRCREPVAVKTETFIAIALGLYEHETLGGPLGHENKGTGGEVCEQAH
jgi:predicted dehydrogenase/threonine dehydrogenase-like Zn-dependent dehydrogenase